jgi:ferritin-like protein
MVILQQSERRIGDLLKTCLSCTVDEKWTNFFTIQQINYKSRNPKRSKIASKWKKEQQQHLANITVKIQDFDQITARVLVPVCEVVGFLLPGRQLDRQTDSKQFLHEVNLI